MDAMTQKVYAIWQDLPEPMPLEVQTPPQQNPDGSVDADGEVH